VRTRRAILPDAEAVHALIREYSGDGTLLPRTFGDICENIRDFVVVEDRGRIVGCGALHIYGPHLCEVRSIAVSPRARGRGAGQAVVRALLREAARHQVGAVCLFTRIPDFFARLGFTIARREDLPDKIFKDCLACPRLHCCDEVPMVHNAVGSELAAGAATRYFPIPSTTLVRLG
jgi:amino-acid N-acetyltransferase